jgi:hypothetical protein
MSAIALRNIAFALERGAMTTPPELSPVDRALLTRHLRIVRGAALTSILLAGVFSPPWEWAANPVMLLPICLLSLPFLAVLWRLRRAPYRDGLALAMVVGGVSAGVAGLALFAELMSSGLEIGGTVLFLTVQGILVVSALVTSRFLRRAEQDAPRPAAPPLLDIPAGDRAAFAKYLWVVRGAAIGSVVMACGLYPPWEWADELATVIFLLVPLGVFSGAILWSVRKAPYKDGLALAVSGGILGLLVTGLAGLVVSREPGVRWSLLAWFVGFGLTQASQIGGALATHRALARATGDWRLFAPQREEEPLPPDLSIFRRPLWCLRLSAIGTIAFLCAAFPLRAWNDGLVCGLVFLLCLPLLVVLSRVRSGPRRTGLRLAKSTGVILALGLACSLLLALGGSGVSRAGVCLALAVAAQALMGQSAVTAQRLLPPSDHRVRGGGGALVYYGFVLLLIVGSPGPLAQRYNRPPAEAVAWLKTLRGCAATYAASHPTQGFPAHLDHLGPQGAGCLASLSSAGERAGYAFTYTPATPGPGGRVPGYRVQARLVNPGWLQQKRFFMDQSGVIHVTEGDRDATPQDPRDPAGE